MLLSRFKTSFLLPASFIFILLPGAFRSADQTGTVTKYGFIGTDGETSSCRLTEQGPVIEWRSDSRLKYSDFKAEDKGSPGFAIATTSSAFGYSITDTDGDISGSIYVRFYCEESWWNPNFRLDEVLDHEQLHFDICELFGRKLYKEVLTLRSMGSLNKKAMHRLHRKLEKQYGNYQDLYDKQTDHSTNGDAQRKWNKKIKDELEALSAYADYHRF